LSSSPSEQEGDKSGVEANMQERILNVLCLSAFSKKEMAVMLGKPKPSLLFFCKSLSAPFNEFVDNET